ncbi:unnamed protein product [Ixodes pacificus]
MNDLYRQAFLFQWNANGLRSKSGDFRQFVALHQFPILAISEARVTAQFRLSNYVTCQTTRPSGPSRAMLCVRKDLTSTLVSTSTEDAPEYVVFKVNIGKVCIVIASVFFLTTYTYHSYRVFPYDPKAWENIRSCW